MQNEHKKIDKIICPECDSEIPFSSSLKLGTVVECPACVTQSEIVDLAPLKLAPLEEEK